MQTEELFATVFVTALFLGVFIVFLGLRQRSLQLEMRHRERMAMIERGQIPLSEASLGPRPTRALPAQRSSRSLSAGIITVGLGLALMTIISIAGESPEVGVGVGGAVAVLGGAFIVRSLVVRNDSQYSPDPFSSSGTGRPTDDSSL
jgi:hypothetical protein